jgi:hypothetical protein
MSKEIEQSRPTLNADESEVKAAEDAVIGFVAELQAGWDQHDAEITDRRLAADVTWGSPFGAIVEGYDQLHAIHVKQPIEPSSDTNDAFSEMALYVLVRRDGTWWVAAGQNTPIRPGGAA